MKGYTKNKCFPLSTIIPKPNADQMSGLELAFIGDAVYALYIKSRLTEKPMKVKDLTNQTSKLLNARAQQKAYFALEPILTEPEKQIAMRARNAKINTKAKNFTIEEYRHATALEALIGYHYIIGNIERLEEIFVHLNLFGE